MNSKAIILALCLTGWAVPASFGYQSSAASLQRTAASPVTLTNSSIVVTATFTNGNVTVLHGLFFSEQVPSSLSVTTLSLTLGGRAVTNYLFEAGQDGDVYSGCTPCRWILEQPAGFAETNPVPSQAKVQIVYALSTASPGSYPLQQFSWAAGLPGLTNAIFGYGEPADQQLLQFVTTAYQPYLTGQHVTNGFTLQLAGVPGYKYAVERSTSLTGWVALTTNVSPFVFTDTTAAGLPRCYYRSRWLP